MVYCHTLPITTFISYANGRTVVTTELVHNKNQKKCCFKIMLTLKTNIMPHHKINGHGKRFIVRLSAETTALISLKKIGVFFEGTDNYGALAKAKDGD